MSTQTPTILITGFGPFPGASQNPSQLLVEAMAEREACSNAINAKLVYGLLPTHWQKLDPALAALFAQHQPDVSLHLGYSARSPGFCLETTAYNQTCAQADIDGNTRSCDPILKQHPLQLKSEFDIAAIKQQLSAAGFTAELSSDPGRYLCNMSYYLSLFRSRTSLFVHIPAISIDAGLVPADHEGDHRLTLREACGGLSAIATALTKP